MAHGNQGYITTPTNPLPIRSTCPVTALYLPESWSQSLGVEADFCMEAHSHCNTHGHPSRLVGSYKPHSSRCLIIFSLQNPSQPNDSETLKRTQNGGKMAQGNISLPNHPYAELYDWEVEKKKPNNWSCTMIMSIDQLKS